MFRLTDVVEVSARRDNDYAVKLESFRTVHRSEMNNPFAVTGVVGLVYNPNRLPITL